MTARTQIPYLYLTTTGWKTGRRHEIEIWFTELNGCYYVISELGERSHWVQNLRRNPHVWFRVGGRFYEGIGRVVDPAHEPELLSTVSRLSIEKYEWGEGLIVELSPS